jgi:two-component system cell cycle sensor histidine kinase/response regulator CckA
VDESNREQSSANLALSKLVSRSLFDAVRHPTALLAPDHKVLAVNRALQQRVGLTESELVGRSCWEVFHSPGRTGPSAACVLKQSLGSAPPCATGHELELPRLGGHFIVTCDPITDDAGVTTAVVHMATDVTDKVQSQAALLKKEHLFRTVFDQAGDYILLVDPTLPEGPTIIDANKAACEKHGYQRDELIGLPMSVLDCPKQTKHIPERALRIMAGEHLVFETVHRRKDGSSFPVEVSAKLVEIGGQPRIFAIERDISERRQAEEERQRLDAQVQQTQKLESLGVMVGGIAHDFNNLLVGVLGNADLMLHELEATHPVRSRVEDISTSATRAAELIRQMLVYAGRARPSVEKMDLNGVVRELAHLMEVVIPKKISLEFDFGSELPVVEADPVQVRQVVMNLITNAGEAIGDQKGTIRLQTGLSECDPASLSGLYLEDALPAGIYAFVEVSDTGVGMDEETRARLFDPFFTTKFTGRGLGLAAVLGTVRSHHGTITIQSAPGEGATIRVLLPATQAVAQSPTAEADTFDPWGQERRVLLVDDELLVRELGRRMLGSLGFRVDLAQDGQQALELIRANTERYCAVLLDVTMPEMDGLECLDQLRKICPELPVVITSGLGEQALRVRCADLPAQALLPKPFRLKALSTALRAALAPAV